MSGPRALQRLCDRLAQAILANAAALLPARRRAWGEAVLAEVEAVDPPAARIAFVVSGALGLVRIAGADALRGRLADPRAVAAAALLGLGAAVADLGAATRWPLRIALGGGCLLLGVLVPRAAWRWGLLAGAVLPVIAHLVGFAGPYVHDRGDVWFPLVPSILLAVAGAALGQRTRRRLCGAGRSGATPRS